MKITKPQPLTACKQYCLAAGATQGNIAYTQYVEIRRFRGGYELSGRGVGVA